MPSPSLRLALVVLAATCLAAGCKGEPEQPREASPRDARGKAAAGEAGGHGVAGTRAAGASSAAAPNGGPGGADEPAAIARAAARAARRAAALAAARPMTIQAATGGVYRSADGKVQVTIPPGALARDAVVRFWTIDTEGLPLGPVGPVGLVIDGDWGGARFEPGALVTFKAPVGDRFLQAVERAGADPASLGVTRDSQDRRYLEVTMQVDEAGRPDSSSRMAVGGGQLIEAARLPVNLDRVAYEQVEARDPDPLPVVPAGVKTLEPLAALDPFVARYPGAPADSFHGAAFSPVRYLDQGGRQIRIRESLPATMADDPAMVTCVFNPCDEDPIKPLEEAIRLNAALSAQRQPPDGLRTRTRDPQLGCPPDADPSPRPEVGLRRLDASEPPSPAPE